MPDLRPNATSSRLPARAVFIYEHICEALISAIITSGHCRGVAQLVARTAGGREVAGSSPVTPTKSKEHFQVFVIIN